MHPRRAIFLDRDGTIIEDPGYLSNPADVRVLPGVADALKRALSCYQLFLFTNQSGIGRGYYSIEDANACNDRMRAMLNLPAPGFSGEKIAPEAPDQPSDYRKPSPRYINEMIAEHQLNREDCWMVGDKLSDVQAGLTAGIRAALIAPARPSDLPPDLWVVTDLPEFIDRLLASL